MASANAVAPNRTALVDVISQLSDFLGETDGFVLLHDAVAGEIETFYRDEMPAKGRAYVATATNDTGGLFIVFGDSASVSVIPLGDEDGTNFVMIVLE